MSRRCDEMNYRRRQVSALLAALATGVLPTGAAAQQKRPEVRVPYLQYPLGGGWRVTSSSTAT